MFLWNEAQRHAVRSLNEPFWAPFDRKTTLKRNPPCAPTLVTIE